MKLFGYLATGLMVAGSAFAAEKKSDKWNKNMFMDGDSLKLTLGIYHEYKDRKEQQDANAGFTTGYTSWKYQTGAMGNLKLGFQVFTHTQLDNVQQSNASDQYESDIEGKHWYLPELWVDYAFSKDTHLRVGRFNHKGVTHIDDSHSEGFYLESKISDQLKIVTGASTRIAEIDYDDGEDFGRINDRQDFSNNDYYGNGSSKWVYFLETTYTPCDYLTLNPYVYTQPGFATVVGMDTIVETVVNDDTTVGVRVNAYNVDEDLGNEGAGPVSDSFNWAVLPYANVGDFQFIYGYIEMDGDGRGEDAANIFWDGWTKDYLGDVLDQEYAYGEQNLTEHFALIGWSPSDCGFWAHYAVGVMNYGWDKEKQAIEHEYQVGYKFDNGFDINVRYFDVNLNDQEDDQGDYNKFEVRARLRF